MDLGGGPRLPYYLSPTRASAVVQTGGDPDHEVVTDGGDFGDGKPPRRLPHDPSSAKDSIAKVHRHRHLRPKRGLLISPTSNIPKRNPPNMRKSKDQHVCEPSKLAYRIEDSNTPFVFPSV